ncbi:hypothetical protein DFQ29_006137 [Apophysomyces sp. BC1021]|nr:hypothetical protein DFQ29_006137 [Apophysomyces sp. BC1021]
MVRTKKQLTTGGKQPIAANLVQENEQTASCSPFVEAYPAWLFSPVPQPIQSKPLEVPTSQPLIKPESGSRLLVAATKIRAMFGYLTDEEIREMLMDCQQNEDEVILRLITQTDYLVHIRNIVAAKHPVPKPIPIAPKQQANGQKPKQNNRAQPLRSIASLPTLQPQSQPQSQPPQPPPLQPQPQPQPVPQKVEHPVRRKYTKHPKEELKKSLWPRARQSHAVGRLALDDALKQVDKTKNPEQAFEGWSQARVRAYQMIDQNPNSYYYRFNAPGEEQRKGPWSDTEKSLFFARLKEMGANTQWGLFSMAVPGRVGYQCSNFYRLLIETNQVQDPNYVLDEKGKAHYLFEKKNADGQVEKTFRKHSKHGSRQAQVIGPEKRRGSGRRRKDDDDDDDDDPDDSGTFTMKLRKTTKSRKPAATEHEDLLPGFIDPITQKPVCKPAISKYGHVMG